MDALENIQTMTRYDELVQEGRQVVRDRDDTNWKAGDLALKVETLEPDEQFRRMTEGVGGSPLKQYAKDIDVNYKSLKNWRGTAAAWPEALRRASVSWATHQYLNAQPDRFELIETVRTTAEAQKIVRDRDTPANKPDTLPASFGDRLLSALGRMAGETTPLENLVMSNDGRKFADRHIEMCARYAEIVECQAELLRRIGQGEFERINAAEFIEILSKPWQEAN